MPDPNQRLAKLLENRFSGQDKWGLLGALEYQLMEALWAQSPATLRELPLSFRTRSYTTLVKALDSLYKKGLVRRERATRSDAYSPTMSRQELETAIVGSITGPSSAPEMPKKHPEADRLNEKAFETDA